ncbi:HalOD1 output domain-containing protein [Halorubrum sp. AD140]|uniref:HalOD1 output domain-containing protein n=1 Tax=Halorubrum sp. AD140 TaxID=3050073 RepID=UPI002ACC473F|nr:HalOD1 output domain-containing protein [Halorubrum sp. AD140]MDZ5810663.1 HalOD1 output domain-containing protein [Halorubrum sp. AD140]
MNIQENGDGKLPVYKVDLDEATDQSASYIVVSSIADLTDRDAAELEPLWDSVDPEGIDSFVTHASESSTPYRLAFEYQGYTVEIEDRWLRFFESEEVRPSASA